jgi:DnaJ-class molecular chaperone
MSEWRGRKARLVVIDEAREFGRLLASDATRVPCTWCSGTGFVGTTPCRECVGTGTAW